ncbi:hypothetical protein GUITHDRAFT_115789 [Guillardia theta CCMP2712]|uniref:Bromo domain-containing protein n=1 Tax=Guillardia theta (strain CCMP2712) TaxID=905079 RepID=L1IP09_GUITC|nr:hypothetical protein GUITHDRAFT_115789 [Guillardia theta CCMP2712]EKX38026.1 hypothetical protein GUITHDRAFT_115789 [Guillardia theta CCMP2712]|eukprot:XP_005825006.1 hypothetical protein GUITHDRAFT_115789 [Guillardia theta CCMP2712]
METDEPRVEKATKEERTRQGKESQQTPAQRKLKTKSQYSGKKASELRKALVTCASIVTELMKHDLAGPFSRPVDPEKDEAPTYYAVIETPMDLGTIMQKYKEMLLMLILTMMEIFLLLMMMEYSNAQEMREDVALVWWNCKQYNGEGNFLMQSAKILSQKFDNEFSRSITPPYHVGVEDQETMAVGRRVKVYWHMDFEWYPGRIDFTDNGRFHVNYDDGEKEYITLPSVDVCFLDDEADSGKNNVAMTRSTNSQSAALVVHGNHVNSNNNSNSNSNSSNSNSNNSNSIIATNNHSNSSHNSAGKSKQPSNSLKINHGKAEKSDESCPESITPHPVKCSCEQCFALNKNTIYIPRKLFNGKDTSDHELSSANKHTSSHRKRTAEELSTSSTKKIKKSEAEDGADVTIKGNTEKKGPLRNCIEIVERMMQDPEISCSSQDKKDSKEGTFLKSFQAIVENYRSGKYFTAREVRRDVTEVWRRTLENDGATSESYKVAKRLAEMFDRSYMRQVGKKSVDEGADQSLQIFSSDTRDKKLEHGKQWIGKRVKIYDKSRHVWGNGALLFIVVVRDDDDDDDISTMQIQQVKEGNYGTKYLIEWLPSMDVQVMWAKNPAKKQAQSSPGGEGVEGTAGRGAAAAAARTSSTAGGADRQEEAGRSKEVKKRVDQMSVQDVKQFVCSVGLSEYAESLMEKQIDGDALLQLRSMISSHEAGGMPLYLLIARDELGIDKVGHALKLARHILLLNDRT